MKMHRAAEALKKLMAQGHLRLEDRIDYETNAHAAFEIDHAQEKLDLLLEMLIADKRVRSRALELMARSKINSSEIGHQAGRSVETGMTAADFGSRATSSGIVFMASDEAKVHQGARPQRRRRPFRRLRAG